MTIAVWDTYVKRYDGTTMHFDILVPDSITDTTTIQEFGRHYLASKSFKIDKLTANECRFCHIEQAPKDVIDDIESKGYSIIEFENCS